MYLITSIYKICHFFTRGQYKQLTSVRSVLIIWQTNMYVRNARVILAGSKQSVKCIIDQQLSSLGIDV